MRADWIGVYPQAEQERVTEAAQRYALVMEDADEIVEDWCLRYVGEDRLAGWGPPDTSRNAIAQVCRAMSVPGSYGRNPAIIGEGSEYLSEAIEASGLWTLSQHRQYLAYGLGCCAIGIDLDDEGGLRFAIVPPHEFYAVADPDDPRRPVAFFRLRLRDLGDDEPVACWDVWDIRGDSPSFRVVVAEDGGELGEDVTVRVCGEGPRNGPDYPCWDYRGRPFLPYLIHRSREVGDLYAHQLGRGAFRGALNSMLLSTYALATARHATGTIAMVSGMTPLGGATSEADGALTLAMRPGDIVYHQTEPGSQPFISEIGPGGHLESLGAFATAYASGVAVEMGVTTTDAVRVGANPMSGVAISLTNAEKREEQRRQAPLCRAVDLQILRAAISLLELEGDVDPRGVGVVYHEIEKSPDEERQEREALAWDVEMGIRSRVDVYLARNPGVRREDAIKQLARIKAEEQQIEETATIAMGEE